MFMSIEILDIQQTVSHFEVTSERAVMNVKLKSNIKEIPI